MAGLPVFFKHKILLILLLVSALCVCGCGSPGEYRGSLPVDRIRQALKNVPTYSIILEDMKADGNFVKKYFHKYKVVQLQETGATDWLEVSEKYYKANEAFLGMSLYAKKDGQEMTTVAPPGYQYVGDTKYGQWRSDNRGNSFWEFYGKYALFSTLLGGWYRPIYRNDYRAYNQNRTSNRPYFGRNNQFGTNGTVAKKNKPDFFSRRTARQKMSKSSFSNKVSQRVGRTRSGFRGRSGGFGK